MNFLVDLFELQDNLPKLLQKKMVNSFLASGDFCHLLINSAKSWDPDQDRQKVSKRFDTLIVLVKDYFETVNVERSQQMTSKA